MAGSDVHFHGQKVLGMGFSFQKCNDVACFEMAENDEAAVKFNQDLVTLSDGQIPPLSALRYLSVGGGHTNAFVRAVKAGCRTSVEGLADESGHLNAEKLSAGQPAFASALANGLKWFIMDGRQACISHTS